MLPLHKEKILFFIFFFSRFLHGRDLLLLFFISGEKLDLESESGRRPFLRGECKAKGKSFQGEREGVFFNILRISSCEMGFIASY